MDIERSVRRDLEYARRQDQAVCCNDQDIRPRRHESIKYAFIFQTVRLKNIQSAGIGELLDRALRSAQAAASRPVRLRQYQRDVMASIKQRRQRARCELWSAGEN